MQCIKSNSWDQNITHIFTKNVTWNIKFQMKSKNFELWVMKNHQTFAWGKKHIYELNIITIISVNNQFPWHYNKKSHSITGIWKFRNFRLMVKKKFSSQTNREFIHWNVQVWIVTISYVGQKGRQFSAWVRELIKATDQLCMTRFIVNMLSRNTLLKK